MNNTEIVNWLDALEQQRRALKMTLPAVAERAKLSRATVCRILQEKRTSASFAHVLAIANVLGARLNVELLNPNEMAEREIQSKARRVARMVQGTMALEAQGMTDQAQIDRLVDVAANEIRAKPRKLLWIKQTRANRHSTPSATKRRSPISRSSKSGASDTAAS
jgi:transcriptional regulator with XRE-family HTH domain